MSQASKISRWLMSAVGLAWLLTSSVVAQTPTPEPDTAQPAGGVTLTLWLPEPLASPDNSEAQAVVEAQIASFGSTHPDVIIERRLKRVGEVGGIMATLRAASNVAPGALPDLTLVRRQDLVAAARDGLIQSLEGRISSAVLGGLGGTLPLGQVNNQLYGVPYLLELHHLVYRSAAPLTDWQYAALLEREQAWLFPAGRSAGMNDVLYLQYLAAGGRMSVEGVLLPDEAALTTTLAYYEAARALGLVDASLLNYSATPDYLSRLLNGSATAGVITSTEYLSVLAAEPGWQPGPIPTPTGTPAAILNGWMWVLVASDPDGQALALDFLNTAVQSEQQLAHALAVHMLPAQQSVLARALPRTLDIATYTQLLDGAILPLTDAEGGAVARAIQENFAALLNGTLTANAAVEAILAQAAN